MKRCHGPECKVSRSVAQPVSARFGRLWLCLMLVVLDYFLRRYREEVIKKRKAVQEIEGQLADYESQLRAQMELEAEAREVAAD